MVKIVYYNQEDFNDARGDDLVLVDITSQWKEYGMGGYLITLRAYSFDKYNRVIIFEKQYWVGWDDVQKLPPEEQTHNYFEECAKARDKKIAEIEEFIKKTWPNFVEGRIDA